MSHKTFLNLSLSLGLGIVAVGCGGAEKARTIGPSPLPSPAMEGNTDTPPGPRASTLSAEIKAAGLDIANLPPLDKLTNDQKKAIMKTFATSLGTTCKDCHSGGKFSDWSPKKHVAAKMWDVFLRQLKLKDGSPFYCDSCHQGKVEFLDTSSEDKLMGWMKRNFVEKLARVDTKPHACNTCHGMPFNGPFLDAWEEGEEEEGEDGGTHPPKDMGSSNPRDGGTTTPPDMAVTPPPPDMAVTPPPADLSNVPVTLNCLQLNDCLVDCSDSACQQACVQKSSQQARQKLSAAIDCGNNSCEGANRCADDSDLSDDCVACFENSLSGGATGWTCNPANDPNCGDCANEWVSCELD